MAGPRPVRNPPNPWLSTSVEWIGPPPQEPPSVLEEKARSILSGNESPDLPFRWSLNPYRGCFHACAYCYARPSHQYLGMGAGTDFDLRIVVKTNAAELLRREITRPSWKGEEIVFSGNTDCYQPLEASYRLTRRCLEVCLERGNPVSVITKGTLVRRDADLLARLAREAAASVFVSIPLAEDRLARAIEPYASLPSQRFETLRLLSRAGIPTGVSVSPMIPGLTDRRIPEILRRAREAGAKSAFMVLLRLPEGVEEVFRQRIEAVLPDLAPRIFSGLAEMRAGRLGEPRFRTRMRGTGRRWEMTVQLFRLWCRRLGFDTPSAREGAGRPLDR